MNKNFQMSSDLSSVDEVLEAHVPEPYLAEVVKSHKSPKSLKAQNSSKSHANTLA